MSTTSPPARDLWTESTELSTPYSAEPELSPSSAGRSDRMLAAVRSVGSAAMSRLLAKVLLVPPIRWVLAQAHLPRPEHLDRMTDAERADYVRAIGLDASITASLAHEEGGDHHEPPEEGAVPTEARSADGRRPRVA